MDPTAVTLCMENKLPIVVFDLMTHGQRPVHPRGRTHRYAGPMIPSHSSRHVVAEP